MCAQSNEAAQKNINEEFPLALPKGTILAGQYTIDYVLGQGGFGITYVATDYKTGQKVAVKEFFPDSLAYREMTTVISYPRERTENYEYGKENFLQEAQTLAEFIGCENIVRIFSYFEENGTAYFVMEYIEGVSFDNYLKEKGGKISCDEAKNILVPVMEALAIVHSKGIVHRDVTPDNIYITSDGKVKLLDFGAARYSLGDKSKSLDVILKHGFAPKEQYTRRGKQGPFTDIYSLGATFYFAVTGRRPPDSIDRLEEDELIPPSSLGVKITSYQEEAILQALEVSPQSRYQSMLDFRNVLLNEAPAPQAATVTQQFFNAPPAPAAMPVQQIPYTAQQPYPVTQPTQKQSSPAPEQQSSTAANADAPVFRASAEEVKTEMENMPPERRGSKKKLAAILIGIVCCLMVVGLGVGLSSSGKNDPIVTSVNVSEETSAASTSAVSVTSEMSVTEKEVSQTAETSAESSGVVWVTKQPYGDGYYIGEWENDLPNGFGVDVFEDADSGEFECYFGNWVNGNADGDFIYLATESDGAKFYSPQTYNMGKRVKSNEDVFYRMWDSNDMSLSGFHLCSSYGSFDEEGIFTDGFYYDLMPKVPSYICQLYSDGEVYYENNIMDNGNSLTYKGGYYVGDSENGVPCGTGFVSYNDDNGEYYGYLMDRVNEEDETGLFYFSVNEDWSNFKANIFEVGDIEWGVGLNGDGIEFVSVDIGYFLVAEGKFVNADITDGKAIILDKNGLPMSYSIYKNGEIVKEYDF